jgi:hypothetical protein
LHVKIYGQYSMGVVVVDGCVVVEDWELEDDWSVDDVGGAVELVKVAVVVLLCDEEVDSGVVDGATDGVNDGSHSLQPTISAGRHFLCNSLK